MDRCEIWEEQIVMFFIRNRHGTTLVLLMLIQQEENSCSFAGDLIKKTTTQWQRPLRWKETREMSQQKKIIDVYGGLTTLSKYASHPTQLKCHVRIFKTHTPWRQGPTMWSRRFDGETYDVDDNDNVEWTTMSVEWTKCVLNFWFGCEKNAFMRSTNFWQTIKNTHTHTHALPASICHRSIRLQAFT